jgi:hypothetical protein
MPDFLPIRTIFSWVITSIEANKASRHYVSFFATKLNTLREYSFLEEITSAKVFQEYMVSGTSAKEGIL